MSIAAQITRLPRAFDAGLGREAAGRVPDLTGEARALVEGAAGSSPYLQGLVHAEGEWLAEAFAAPEAALEREMFALGEIEEAAALGPALRRAKRRVALLTALADLGGAWPLERVTRTLTDFADLSCALALRAAIAPLIRRGKLPGQGEDDIPAAGGMVIMAMGKMGAGELNYSSDIDLICLFDETRFDPETYHEARQGFVKATRALCAMLSDRTAEGYVFRTDLRLRPDPSVTPVCLAMEAAERYYESLGRTWERAAFIKARPAVGDVEAGERFLATLRPFVWRRHLDFAAIQDAHDMRLRIRGHKGFGRDLNVPGHDMKLGPGGIREIEFFTQTRQLIAGGRDADLRLRGTVDGLGALAAKGWVPQEVAERLSDHYRAHRETEHRVQMLNDAQTHRVPTGGDALERLACLKGQSTEEMLEEIADRLRDVHALTEDFFAPETSGSVAATPDHPAFDPDVMARWLNYPALRSARAASIFERLKPELLARLARAPRPEAALSALDGFLAGLPAGVQLFSLFEANPQLIDLLADIVSTAPGLAAYLSRNSAVFDAVIGGDFFDPWPGEAALAEAATAIMAAEDDYERKLDALRRWRKEWHFRVGVHHLRGLIDAQEAGRDYADLAGAVIAALAPVVVAEFAAKHGAPPGRGAAILGMGSLGARRLNASSDLDVIAIYDPAGQDSSDGRRPLPSGTYYARLTKAMITAMSAPMSEGRLYEIDMRLRPSGNQGPVATALRAFREYQTGEAWVWEHLALTRARVVFGPAELASEIEALREEILERPRDKGRVLAEVAWMRDRIRAAKPPGSVWDAKTGPGRLQEIELLAQAGALLSGRTGRGTAEGLEAAASEGWLAADAAARLAELHALFWRVTAAVQLMGRSDGEEFGAGGSDFLLRGTGERDLDVLAGRLEDGYVEAAALIDKVLAPHEKDVRDAQR